MTVWDYSFARPVLDPSLEGVVRYLDYLPSPKVRA